MEIILDIESTDQEVQFNELLNSLNASQIIYNVDSESGEEFETIVSFDAKYEDQVLDILKVLGIELILFDHKKSSEDILDKAISGDLSIDEAIISLNEVNGKLKVGDRVTTSIKLHQAQFPKPIPAGTFGTVKLVDYRPHGLYRVVWDNGVVTWVADPEIMLDRVK